MEGTEDGITLAIKPNGITCTLSKFLPQYIAKNISFFADGFLKKNNLSRDDGEEKKPRTSLFGSLFRKARMTDSRGLGESFGYTQKWQR